MKCNTCGQTIKTKGRGHTPLTLSFKKFNKDENNIFPWGFRLHENLFCRLVKDTPTSRKLIKYIKSVSPDGKFGISNSFFYDRNGYFYEVCFLVKCNSEAVPSSIYIGLESGGPIPSDFTLQEKIDFPNAHNTRKNK